MENTETIFEFLVWGGGGVEGGGGYLSEMRLYLRKRLLSFVDSWENVSL